MDPLVSVIIPVKNRSEQLLSALISLENQVFRDFEILVVDDDSDQSPMEALGGYKPQTHRRGLGADLEPISIRWMKSTGRGVSAARNTGIRASHAEIIGLLDSDDEWSPMKLLKQIQFLHDHPEIPLVHTEEVWIRNGVRVNPMRKHKKSGGRIFDRCTELCLIAPSASVFRRSLLDDVGLFNEEFEVCEDYELWLRVTSRFEVGFVDEPLTIRYGGHSDQLSTKFHSMDLWRVRALASHLDSQHLSESESRKIREQIRIKSEVLLKGFLKHQNYTHLNEVQDLLKRAMDSKSSRV